jgi:adenosylmethionine-8-amino-7-oxononanoate aminotransferase
MASKMATDMGKQPAHLPTDLPADLPAGMPSVTARDGSALPPTERARLQQQIKDHLLLNFTDMSEFTGEPGSTGSDVRVFVRGDGCYVIDADGRRAIDGISGLFCSNLGHSYGDEIGRAAHAQLSTLAFTPSWYITNPVAAALAERLSDVSGQLGLHRVFLTSGGGEANEAMYKLARQYHAANGQPQRRKAIARRLAYHGTSLGALSLTGLPYCKTMFEPLPIQTAHVGNTNAYRHPLGHDEDAFTAALLAEVEDTIEWEGAENIALLIAEPVQNSGGSFTPPKGYWQGLRAICDKHGILLVADEVITGFGRLGDWFASLRYEAQPDMIVFAKGVTAGMAPLGGVLMNDRVAEPFVTGTMFMHGLTYGGHPMTAAVALKALEIYERDGVIDNVRENEPYLRAALEELRRVPLVGDVRGAGYFWSVEMVKDRDTRETFSDAEADWLLRDVLTAQMVERGLLCRLDDRGDPVIQLSPPLIATREELDFIHDVLDTVLDEAWDEMQRHHSAGGHKVVTGGRQVVDTN